MGIAGIRVTEGAPGAIGAAGAPGAAGALIANGDVAPCMAGADRVLLINAATTVMFIVGRVAPPAHIAVSIVGAICVGTSEAGAMSPA